MLFSLKCPPQSLYCITRRRWHWPPCHPPNISFTVLTPSDISATFHASGPSFSLSSFGCTHLTQSRLLPLPLKDSYAISSSLAFIVLVSHVLVLMGAASHRFGSQTDGFKSETWDHSVSLWTLLSISFLFCKMKRIAHSSQDFCKV